MKENRRKEPVPKTESATSFRGRSFPATNKSHHEGKRPVSKCASEPLETPKNANKVVKPGNRAGTLRESRAIAQALMNAPLDALTVLGRDGTFLEVNTVVCKTFGLPRDALIGRSAWDLFPAQVTEQRKAAFEEARQTSNMVRFEDERDGRYFDHVIYPIMEPDGNINKFVVIARDITELKKTEKDLRESEEKYRLVVERTSDMVSIVTFSAPPSYVYVNPSYHVILGYKPEDLIGKSPFGFMHAEDREQYIPVLGRYLNAKSQGLIIRGGKGPTERMLYRLKDAWGNWRYLEGTADLMGEEHILMVSRDVSERIKTERDLERARKELEGKVEDRTRELKMKTESLEETNTALKVLLEIRERDKKELEQSVMFNVRQLAEPYLDKLMNNGLNETQKGYLDILKSSLQELVSPLSKDLVVSGTNLTPSQVRIANLIKFGRSSKEIAETLNLSINTVQTHRRKIRAKLGLNRNKGNLRSYLQQSAPPHKP